MREFLPRARNGEGVTDYLRLLRSCGLRVTAQRSTLLKLLCEVEGHQHITAKELFLLAAPILPGLNLATVYRTLDGLFEAGLVDRMNTGRDQVHYSYHDPEHRHGHLCCRNCGAVSEFNYAVILALSQQIRKSHQFQIDREHLTFTGQCEQCLASDKLLEVAK